MCVCVCMFMEAIMPLWRPPRRRILVEVVAQLFYDFPVNPWRAPVRPLRTAPRGNFLSSSNYPKQFDCELRHEAILQSLKATTREIRSPVSKAPEAGANAHTAPFSWSARYWNILLHGWIMHATIHSFNMISIAIGDRLMPDRQYATDRRYYGILYYVSFAIKETTKIVAISNKSRQY